MISPTLSRLGVRPLLACLALLGGLLLGTTPPAQAAGNAAAGGATKVAVKEAPQRLKTLRSLLGKRSSTSEELRGALRDVVDAYVHHAGDPKQRDAFRKTADRQLARAVTLHQVARRGGEENLRDAFVDFTAEALAGIVKDLDAKARGRLALAITKAAGDRLKKLKPRQLSDLWLDSVFLTLARLGGERTFQWFMDGFVHARAREARQIAAAQRAMATFTDVSGAKRHRLADLMLRTYEGVEAAARRNAVADQPLRRLWDDIRLAVIPLMQRITGGPVNEKGVAFSSMQEFRRWWTKHKNPHKAPWRKV